MLQTIMIAQVHKKKSVLAVRNVFQCSFSTNFKSKLEVKWQEIETSKKRQNFRSSNTSAR